MSSLEWNQGITPAPAAPLARAVSLLALTKLLVHLLTARGYGWFRDEFYYIACSEHLAFGYVDHPPLVALLTAATRGVAGDSIIALRALPAVAGAATVWTTGLLARELGAGRFGQSLAALAVLVAPLLLSLQHFVSMNAYEPLLWTLCAWVLVRALRTERTRDWVWAGVIAGIGLQNKHSMLFFGFAFAAGLLLSPQRRVLATRGPWLAAAVAAGIFLPNVVWQIQHGWPTLEFMANARRVKMVALPVAAFLREQVLTLNPLALPVWLAGLWTCLRSTRARPFGWGYLALLGLFIATGAKPYYLASYYPILFAAGGLSLEGWVRSAAARAVGIAVLVASGAALLPLALPVLPVDTFVRYASRLGVSPESGERHRQGRLPQFYADMFGWEELVAEVGRVSRSLPDDERAKVVVFARNYGEAGAINFLGRSRGLPPAISGHNNFWLWGPGPATGEILLVLGGRAEQHDECAQVTLGGRVRCRDCMPYQDDLPIWVCRDLRVPIAEAWRATKHYD